MEIDDEVVPGPPNLGKKPEETSGGSRASAYPHVLATGKKNDV